MKRWAILICTLMLVLVSCSKPEEDNIVETEEEAKTEVSIIPSYSLSEDQYKMVLPYRPSEARGAITNQITNRVDIDELEQGLRRHSTPVFDPEKYVFEEGQHLNSEDIYDLIEDLNPEVKEKKDKKEQEKEHRANPRIFSHILEQNYLEKSGNQVDLAGVSIGISLKSVYRFQTETGGPYHYEDIPKDEMMKEGKEIAQKVLEELRQKEGLEEVPIMIALFREEEQSSPVPGNFVTKTVVDKGAKNIDKWETIQEEYVLFPSGNAKKKYNEDYQKVKSFGDKVAEYFPNYVGVAGEGFYIDKDLNRLTIEVPIEFYGKGEVVGFTQYAYKQLKDIFPNHYDIEISISSSDGAESLIYRKAGDDEPKVHIYH